jgi:superkiller protein 3
MRAVGLVLLFALVAGNASALGSALLTNHGNMHLVRAASLEPSYSQKMTQAGEAVDAFQCLIRVQPHNVRSLRNLGLAQVEQHCWTEAIATLTQYAATTPDDSTTYFFLGNAYEAAGDEERAVIAWTKAGLGERLLERFWLEGHRYMAEGDYPAAEAQYRLALLVEPAAVRFYYQLAGIHLALNEPLELRDALRAALPLDTSHSYERLFWQAQLHLLQGELESAVIAFREALEMEPNDPLAHHYLGLVLSQQGKVEQARHEFETALALDPGFVGAKQALDQILPREQGE